MICFSHSGTVNNLSGSYDGNQIMVNISDIIADSCNIDDNVELHDDEDEDICTYDDDEEDNTCESAESDSNVGIAELHNEIISCADESDGDGSTDTCVMVALMLGWWAAKPSDLKVALMSLIFIINFNDIHIL